MNGKLNARRLLYKIINVQEITSIIPPLALALTAVILNPIFLRPRNLATLASAMIGVWGILAIAQAFMIIVGEIDLSMGTLLGFTATLLSLMLRNGVPMLIGFAVVFVITLGVSLINACVVLKLRVPVFIATIGMMFICRGLARVVNNGSAVSIFATGYAVLDTFVKIGNSRLLGLSVQAWIFILLTVIAQIVLKKTSFGRMVYAIGDNRKVAKTAGIKVARIKTICFLINGVLVGIASILWTASHAGAVPTHGTGWEFVAITAVALGGVSLIGGRGSIVSVFFGVISMALIYNLITLLRINPQFQNIVVGLFLAFAVTFDVIRREKMIGKNI